MDQESVRNDCSEEEGRNGADTIWQRQPEATIPKVCQVGDEYLLRNSEAGASDRVKQSGYLRRTREYYP